MIDGNSMMLVIAAAIPMMIFYSKWEDDGFRLKRRRNPFKDTNPQ